MLIFLVALGGAIGSVLRYFVTTLMTNQLGSNFPYGTMIVNISGSIFMGVFIGLLSRLSSSSMEMRAFLTVGILGGYTTFSSFSLDALTLYERGEIKQAAIYISSSLVLSLLGIFIGMISVRIL